MSGFHKSRIVFASLLLASTSVVANSQPPLKQQVKSFDFNLPAEPLSQALRDVAIQTGRNVIASDALVQARQASPLLGAFTAEQAVDRLLRGSGLQLSFNGTDLVVVAGAPPISNSGVGAENPASITVTGTRIRGVGSASPVIVSTRSDLENAGVNSLADFTRVLPQNYAGGTNRGIVGGGQQGGQENINDSSALNLRGLGPDATLTLLNGHRLSYDALDQGVDVSAIPLSAIDHIEVVADGSSALYGSDAVAGVANIILRHNYEGLETTARVGAAADGGDVQQEYSLVGGHLWSSGGFMVTLDQSYATPITAGQRDYARSDNPSLFLNDDIRQSSGIFSAHQQVAPCIEFDVDGTLMNRSSLIQDPYYPGSDVHVGGLVIQDNVRSYSLAPTFRADLGSWQASLDATLADSRTFLDSTSYTNGVPRESHLLYEDNSKSAEANAEGPLFALPGGDARLAVGGGLRKVWLHDRVAVLTAGHWLASQNSTQSRNVEYAYGELSLPLVRSDLNVPLINRLIITGALRYEHWNGIAAVTTPKLGAIYEPTPGLVLRATWGKSFKVPTLYQINEVRQGALLPAFIFTPPPQPAGSPVLLVAGGNPDLKPERATTWSATAELSPGFIHGLNLQATYFHVDYRDRIVSPLTGTLTSLYNPLYNNLIVYDPSAAQVNAAIATLPQGLLNETGAPFNPGGVGAIIDDSIQNSARERVHGVDLNADYRLELGSGMHLLVTGGASYLASDRQLAANRPFLQLAGTIFNPPHWRGRAGAVLDGPHVGFSAYLNYIGSTIDNRFPVAETIDPFVTLDLNASFRTGREAGVLQNVEVRFTVLNALGQKPHIIRAVSPGDPPYDSTNETAVGRFLGVSLRKVW